LRVARSGTAPVEDTIAPVLASSRAFPGGRVLETHLTRKTILVCALLTAASVAVFARVSQNDFVNFDDPQVITAVPQVTRGLSWSGIAWAFTTPNQGNWNPLTTMSHMLDCELFGLDARGHHLVSLGLHVINTILLFLVFSAMTGATWRSAFVAALFALHPLHVESVAWAAERKDVLSGFFFLVALRAYGWHAQKPSLGRFSVVGGTALLGMLAKPMVVTLPFILLLIDFWPLGELFPGRATEPSVVPSAGRWARWRVTSLGLFIEKTPLFILSGVFSFITYAVQGQAVEIGESLPIGFRVQNALVSYGTYLFRTVWPTGLTAYYPLSPAIDYRMLAGSVIALVAVSALALWRPRVWPYLVVGWFWFLGMLVPVIGLVQVGGQATADRYTYLPIIGLFVIVSWGADAVTSRWVPLRRIAIVGAVAVLGVLGLLSWQQVGTWKDSVHLYTRMIDVTEDNALAHVNLGAALARESRNQEAVQHYAAAININPDFELAHFNLGLLLLIHGASDPAAHHFREVLRINPGNRQARNYLSAIESSAAKARDPSLSNVR
jgi:protein O-mannosyl-transferase